MVYYLILPLFPFSHCIYSIKRQHTVKKLDQPDEVHQKELQNILLLKVFEHLVLKNSFSLTFSQRLFKFLFILPVLEFGKTAIKQVSLNCK